MFLGPLEDGIQPAVAADPGQGALDPNTLWDEGSAVTSSAGLDGNAKRLASFGRFCQISGQLAESAPSG